MQIAIILQGREFNFFSPTPTKISIGATTPSVTDVASAHAILAIRSVIQSSQNQRSCLVPYDWSRRYGKYLGSYVSFIRSKSPEVFLVEEEANTGLYFLSLTRDFQQRGYLSYQRIIDAGVKLDIVNDFHGEDDPYSEKIAAIFDPSQRIRISGGQFHLKSAEGIVRQFVSTLNEGVHVDRLRKLLRDSGVPPIPLEWFSDTFVLCKPGRFFRKRTSTAAICESQNEEESRILALLNGSDQVCASIDTAAKVLGLTREEAAKRLRAFPQIFYQPDMLYSCEQFENLVIGYASPETREREVMDTELTSMSPFVHLLRSIEAVLENLPNGRLGTEYILAWCASLDVSPRHVWQCLRHKVVWGSNFSDEQIFIRISPDKDSAPHSFKAHNVPKDVVQSIKSAIRKVGFQCSLDKLASALRWTKNSENRKRYGLLRSVLTNIPGVFYDPKAMYRRSALEEAIQFQTESSDTEAASVVKRLDYEFVSLAQISAALVYYLSQTGCDSYSREAAVTASSLCGLGETTLFRLNHVFIPGNYIYLRANIDDFAWDMFPLHFMLYHALKTSTRRALDFQAFFRILMESKRFTSEEIESLRSEVVLNCRSLSPSSIPSIARFCYYNPDVVLLDSVTTQHLAIPPQDAREVRVSDFIVRDKEEIRESSEDECEEPGSASIILPDWCKVGVIVNLTGSNEDLIIARVDPRGMIVTRALTSEDPGSERRSFFELLKPRSLRVSDTVLVMGGALAGRSGQLIGLTPTEGSVQFSKFEFRPFPLALLAPFINII